MYLFIIILVSYGAGRGGGGEGAAEGEGGVPQHRRHHHLPQAGPGRGRGGRRQQAQLHQQVKNTRLCRDIYSPELSIAKFAPLLERETKVIQRFVKISQSLRRTLLGPSPGCWLA